MKGLKKLVMLITIGCFLSCAVNKPRYSKFHKTHQNVKDNSKY
jgi:hypothetical protein